MAKVEGLTLNEQRWLDNYLISGNKSAAYSIAYPNANDQTALKESKRIIKRPRVAAALEKALEEERLLYKTKFHETVLHLEQTFYDCIAKKTDALGNDIPSAPSSAVAALAEMNRMLGHHAAVKVENSNPEGATIRVISVSSKEEIERLESAKKNA